jgi:hypothetical protein
MRERVSCQHGWPESGLEMTNIPGRGIFCIIRPARVTY